MRIGKALRWTSTSPPLPPPKAGSINQPDSLPTATHTDPHIPGVQPGRLGAIAVPTLEINSPLRMHDSCFVTETSRVGTNLRLAPICFDCMVHCKRADSCTVSDRAKHTHFTHCRHLPSRRPVSLNTGSSLCVHCCLCRNDLEINGLGVILCLSHKPRRNMTRALR